MPKPEIQPNMVPSKNLLKRIDIGLTTGIIAVLISFLALLTSYTQIKMGQEAQKASVLPIIAVNLGYSYGYGDTPSTFDISLTNDGAGIAHIQRVRAFAKGELADDDEAFTLALMNGRMRGNAVLTNEPGAGFLAPGATRTMWSFSWGKSLNSRSEIEAYLRGQFGTPLEGVDVEVCYCSVFEECWTASYLDRRKPQSIKTCGPDDGSGDIFQTFIEQRSARRMTSE